MTDPREPLGRIVHDQYDPAELARIAAVHTEGCKLTATAGEAGQ